VGSLPKDRPLNDLSGIWELLNNYNPHDRACHWGMFRTVVEFCRKYPKRAFPGFLYDREDDNYYPPRAVMAMIKRRDKGLGVEIENYATEYGVSDDLEYD